MFFLWNVIVGVVLGLVIGLVGVFMEQATGTDGSRVVDIVRNLLFLLLLIPTLALGARRLHDTGRSGWWLLIGLVPVIGIIVLIILFVIPSDGAATPPTPPPPTETPPSVTSSVPPEQI